MAVVGAGIVGSLRSAPALGALVADLVQGRGDVPGRFRLRG